MAQIQIYQLLVRHFGNTNGNRKPNGSIQENGCGKFNDISDVALRAIKAMGYTHVWFTGVLEHASGTAYPTRPADDPLLLKGKAGSPYAIRDYFDVSPDLAEDVEDRIEEFRALLTRCKDLDLVAIIDFIPNHVARSYGSDIKPAIDFGSDDKKGVFFDPDNNFFYLEGDGPLLLPAGPYAPESKIGRVTGNNAMTWNPSKHDWYETVKLNYGHDFRAGPVVEEFENIPDTWLKMNQVLAYWQDLGVRGFRCDMAHMVPMPFWKWLVAKARERDSKVFFTGEAYDKDPMKLTQGNVLHELLQAGFDAVYDSETYDIVKGIYEEGKWANDIDELLWDEPRLHSMLRYVENHDEVRVASPQHWGGWGANVGKAAAGVLFGIGKGPVMLYSGQEVAEPAKGAEGFGGDDGRSSIFDYWCLPELEKWVNTHLYDGARLDTYQTELRNWYSWWLNYLRKEVFCSGKAYGLNGLNRNNPKYGRLENEIYSGHWLYAYLRFLDHEAILVLVNLHPTQTMEDIEVFIPEAFMTRFSTPACLKLDNLASCEVKCIEYKGF